MRGAVRKGGPYRDTRTPRISLPVVGDSQAQNWTDTEDSNAAKQPKDLLGPDDRCVSSGGVAGLILDRRDRPPVQ